MQNKELMKILSTHSINKRNQQIMFGLIVVTGITFMIAHIHYKNNSIKEKQIILLLEEKINLLSSIKKYQSEINELNGAINKIVQDEAAKTLPVNNAQNKSLS